VFVLYVSLSRDSYKKQQPMYLSLFVSHACWCSPSCFCLLTVWSQGYAVIDLKPSHVVSGGLMVSMFLLLTSVQNYHFHVI